MFQIVLGIKLEMGEFTIQTFPQHDMKQARPVQLRRGPIFPNMSSACLPAITHFFAVISLSLSHNNQGPGQDGVMVASVAVHNLQWTHIQSVNSVHLSSLYVPCPHVTVNACTAWFNSHIYPGQIPTFICKVNMCWLFHTNKCMCVCTVVCAFTVTSGQG